MFDLGQLGKGDAKGGLARVRNRGVSPVARARAAGGTARPSVGLLHRSQSVWGAVPSRQFVLVQQLALPVLVPSYHKSCSFSGPMEASRLGDHNFSCSPSLAFPVVTNHAGGRSG